MSLAEKWNEYSVKHGMWANHIEKEIAQRAFYAGAEAWRDASENGSLTADLNAEIDHFRSHQ